VTERSVGDTAVHMSRHRKWRVHEHDHRTHGGIEMVVDVGGVVSGDAVARKQTVEQICAGVGDLVQDQAATGKFGMNGEEPGARRGLQHEIGGRNRGGRGGYEA
jgi:hypothetical protein